jgi:hypothetical protein
MISSTTSSFVRDSQTKGTVSLIANSSNTADPYITSTFILQEAPLGSNSFVNSNVASKVKTSTRSSIIHVDYDLPGLQQGAMFVIPSGLDDGKGRLFRVVRLTNSIVYPASIACELVPEYQDNFIPETNYDYENTSFNLLNREDEAETEFNV